MKQGACVPLCEGMSLAGLSSNVTIAHPSLQYRSLPEALGSLVSMAMQNDIGTLQNSDWFRQYLPSDKALGSSWKWLVSKSSPETEK
jgi:hypothetical protein